MLPFLLVEVASLTRMIQAASAIVLWLAFAPAMLRSAEPRLVALHGFEATEVRQQGFSLPTAMKIHVYARGGALRTLIPMGQRTQGRQLFAYGWILNAETREVVWQMDGTNTRRSFEYRIADQYLDLPQGRYEAYFANHAFGRGFLLAQWEQNLDRRGLQVQARPQARPQGWSGVFGTDQGGFLRHWQAQVGNYGLEIYLPAGDPAQVTLFEAPLPWQNAMLRLPAQQDGGHWSQTFRLRKAVSLHVYAEGEGGSRRLTDYGWIQEVQSRKRVWEMTIDKALYAGGARKNRRQVETIQLPAGEYEAHYITDDSHSPADWNGAPPCDPMLYGLTLSLPHAAELSAFTLTEAPSWAILGELVRVGDDQDRRMPLVLSAERKVRVLAIGEGDEDEMADEAWIEDAAGKRVWSLAFARSLHAGGSGKNRMADEIVTLAKGTYTLRVHTDGSHAYGRWNSAAPWDPEHYGITVFAAR